MGATECQVLCERFEQYYVEHPDPKTSCTRKKNVPNNMIIKFSHQCEWDQCKNMGVSDCYKGLELLSPSAVFRDGKYFGTKDDAVCVPCKKGTYKIKPDLRYLPMPCKKCPRGYYSDEVQSQHARFAQPEHIRSIYHCKIKNTTKSSVIAQIVQHKHFRCLRATVPNTLILQTVSL